MKKPKFCVMLLLVLFLVVEKSNATDGRESNEEVHITPKWIKYTPKSTRYKFYVGRGSGKMEQEAIQKALQDAYDQAIREDFGIKTKIDAWSQETMNDVKYEKIFSEKSGQVQLVRFKREKIHIEKENNIFHVWCLFKYPLQEMKKEKKG